MICPDCNGSGSAGHILFTKPMRPELVGTEMKCQLCGGSGQIDEATHSRWQRGKELRKRRLAAGYGLRRFAETIGVLPSKLSYVEQGLADPDWDVEGSFANVENPVRPC